MKKVLYPALVALALLGASNSWAAFPALGAKGKAIATGVGVVAVAAACGLVAENSGDDEGISPTSASITTTTRTK
ncbi:hypothetical protein [Serratia aquatilis]|uniref:Uncharacterized protein n=1 Tax=Serratia aquatilis TaxID=1737515 RepID=A0ABV6EGD3_9GAMM